MATGGLRGVLIGSLAANAAVAVAAFFAAAWSGASAVLAVALLAAVNAVNQGLLWLNIGRARQPADAAHPFGYAKELYFWSFVVAILLFPLAAGVALHDGIGKLVDPRPVTDARTNYLVLAAAFGLVGLATARAVLELRRRRGPSALAALRASRTPVLFTVLIEGFAALAGLSVAALGVLVSDLSGRPAADAYAAILVGLLLGGIATLVSIEIRRLIVGEAAPPAVRRDIHEAIVAEVGPGRPIRAVNEIRTQHLGPRSLLVVASVDFDDGQPAVAIEAAVARIERTMRERVPAVRRIFIEGQSARDHADAEEIMAGRPAGRQAASTPARKSAAGAPASRPSADPQAPSAPDKRLSRKERKRQRHRR